MSDIKNYQIRIGKTVYFDGISQETNVENILKGMRIRIGTLLKTDNISFLLGAGASIKASGVSLAAIPQSLEWRLLKVGISGKEKKIIPG